MNIKIIAVGKIKEKYIADGIKEYSKRLSRFCRLEIVEVSDLIAPENASVKQEEDIKKKEGEQILSHIKQGMYVIALCIEGRDLDSLGLAKAIDNLGIMGNSNICIIIGGSLGLSEQIKKIADLQLSFSKMTYPHQLMRLILVEQIYRVFKINGNETYHK